MATQESRRPISDCKQLRTCWEVHKMQEIRGEDEKEEKDPLFLSQIEFQEAIFIFVVEKIRGKKIKSKFH